MKLNTQDKIYSAVILVLDELECRDLLRVNSHHLGQKLSYLVEGALLPNQQKVIYDQLTKTPTKTIDIARALGMTSKNVSSQLKQMYNSTRLIGCKTEGLKFKYWYKLN